MMKRYVALFVLFISIQAYAIDNLKLNGQSEITVTELNSTVVVTCDLAAAGNRLVGGVYVDWNEDGFITPHTDEDNIVLFWGYITDGIGWILNPANLLLSMVGDETGVDGKLQITYPILRDIVMLYSKGTVIIQLQDEDGSIASAIAHINVEPQPPMIIGQITDAQSGTPLGNVPLWAENQLNLHQGKTDESGQYFIMVNPGAWNIITQAGKNQGHYMNSAIATVVVGNNETVTANLTMQKYASTIEGHLLMEDGSPVPGIEVCGRDASATYSAAVTDNDGFYSLGLPAGHGNISINYQNENIFHWPEGHYPDPADQDILVNEGETATADFTFRPYTAFIEGRITEEGIGLPNINIMALFNQSGESFRTSETYSDEDGYYRIGVLPGEISSLQIWDVNYDVISPAEKAYKNFTIEAGDTLQDKDFELSWRIFFTYTFTGNVTFTDGTPAENVYVCAAHAYSCNDKMRFIDYTDEQGNFAFTTHWSGSWLVGVYNEGSTSTPPIYYYENLQADTSISNINFVLTRPTEIESKETEMQPDMFSLAQNYPNPFNPVTTISFVVKDPCHVLLKVYDILGQEVTTLVNAKYNRGCFNVKYNANGLASGLYLYTIEMGDFKAVRKMLLLE